MGQLELSASIKINRSFERQLAASILAGVCISIACIGLAFVKSDSPMFTSISGILSGVIFSYGLFMIFANGFELLTSNCLMLVPLLSNKITLKQMLKVWTITLLGNFIGCCIVALMFLLSKYSYIDTVHALANAKIDLSPFSLIFRGVLCNIVICLASLTNNKGTSLLSNFLAAFLPVVLFVACGFEHSIADIFILLFASKPSIETLLCFNYVLIGNILGGLFVSAMYTLFVTRSSYYDGY